MDPSLRELISLLDFRADMILSAFEREREDLEAAGCQRSRDQGRNLVVDQLAGRVEKAARLFAELHEQNKKALAERAFIRSHEITGQIRQLLEDVKRQVDWRVYGMMFPGDYLQQPPTPWWFVKDYPGVLSPQLTADPSVRSIAEGWAASVAPAASAPSVEETSPFFDDELARSDRAAAEEWRRQAEERRREQEDHRRRVKQRREEASASLEALRKAGREKGLFKEGDVCPRCQFGYAWDGTDCHHCKYHKD
jgi:hypothetical protein